MADRDVERITQRKSFAELLRRIADSVEKEESFRIQVLNTRLTVPKDAELSVEHEREGDDEEVELQFRWKSATPGDKT